MLQFLLKSAFLTLSPVPANGNIGLLLYGTDGKADVSDVDVDV